LHEHGTDSGCGDNNWPKTFVFLAGWGFGHATLNGRPLYQNYEMHFMVTQGIRDRKTLRVNYPMANKKSAAGEVNPAAQQIDFYIRSPQQNPKNKPNRPVFMHFFGMEVPWKGAGAGTPPCGPGAPRDSPRLRGSRRAFPRARSPGFCTATACPTSRCGRRP